MLHSSVLSLHRLSSHRASYVLVDIPDTFMVVFTVHSPYHLLVIFGISIGPFSYLLVIALRLVS